MLASISPFGERARQQRWGITIAAYTVASIVAGASLGPLLGAAGVAARDVSGASARLRLLAVATVALAGVLADAGVAGLRVPGPRRQVDETWLGRYRGWVYGAAFGVQLGAGFTTIVAASTTY